MKQLDRMAVGAANLVVLDTQEHQHMLAVLESNTASMVVPVGAPDEWYAARAVEPGAGSPKTKDVVFYGLYTPLQGVPVIAEAAAILAQRGHTPHFTLIGKGQDYDQVRTIAKDLANVEFKDWVEPEELPKVVASHAISLGIFSTTPKGLHVVPNKVYQSMAAGCAVITSDTVPQRRMLDDGVTYVRPGDAQALADAIERLTTDDDALSAAQQAAALAAQSFTDVEVTRELYSWVLKTNR